ncbi:regulator of G-protein signaling 21-like [Entelurus aequoreus]|uniref:regulator of G-protein signaling 21-like n=1 Tax=Entelurus aequoreus TaxID=161455 RepID=UPI002B1E0A40|nr:regulator of G-protein signaling 21-like [Entelurus aequoreus]
MWKTPGRFSLTGRWCCFPQDPLEDLDAWTESVDKVLACKTGQAAFRDFLRSEHSEENLQFWLACEDYKKIKSVPEMITCANRIYSEFVQTEAPRQINIDCHTREKISSNICQPSLTSFDAAQKLIYCLMSRDCYPRFLTSDIYAALLRRSEATHCWSLACKDAPGPRLAHHLRPEPFQADLEPVATHRLGEMRLTGDSQQGRGSPKRIPATERPSETRPDCADPARLPLNGFTPC